MDLIKKLREFLKSEEIDYLLVNATDKFLVEYSLLEDNSRYFLTGFAGSQESRGPNFTQFAWGVGPYLSFDITDYLSINAMYQYYNYADVQRHYFTIYGTLRLYKKNAKK